MTRPYFRLLDARNRSASTTNGSDGSPGTDAASSDFVLILAALLCALICVLGLVAIARCAWLRRLSREQSPNSSKANRALKKKILRSLPTITFAPESPPKFSDCAICLAEFAAGDEIRVLPQCSHSFHVACIDTWLGSHSSCPSCRQILVLSASCEKCGDFPDNSTGGGGGGGGGVGGGVEAEAIEARLKYREDINRFLP